MSQDQYAGLSFVRSRIRRALLDNASLSRTAVTINAANKALLDYSKLVDRWSAPDVNATRWAAHAPLNLALVWTSQTELAREVGRTLK